MTTVKNRVSKMELLGYTNPLAAKGYDKKLIEFRTIRGHQLVYNSKKNQHEVDNRTMNLHFSVPECDEIVVPRLDENGKPIPGDFRRAIIAYVKGADSIFIDEIMEQNGYQTQKDALENAEPINFYDEALYCSFREVNKIAYLRATNLNADVKGEMREGSPTFYEYDTTSISEKRVKETIQGAKVKSYVLDMIEKGQTTTQWGVFVVSKNISLKKAQEQFSLPQVQDFILSWVEKDPVSFDKMLNDPSTTDRMYAIQAIAEGFYSVRQDGEIRNQKDEVLAIAGLNGNPAEALMNQMDESQLRDMRREMSPKFFTFTEKEVSESERIQQLIRENEKLQKYKEMADTVDAEKLDKVVGEVSKTDATKMIHGMASEEGGNIFVIEMGRWVKDGKDNDLLPDKAENNGKTWSIDTLSEFYHNNPGEYKKLLSRV